MTSTAKESVGRSVFIGFRFFALWFLLTSIGSLFGYTTVSFVVLSALIVGSIGFSIALTAELSKLYDINLFKS